MTWLINLWKSLSELFVRRKTAMWLLDDLIKALVERNEIVLNGGITIGLVNGGVKLKGEISGAVQDRQKNNKTIATMVLPLSAQVTVGELVIPVRVPQK
jgi:hypothetical protein